MTISLFTDPATKAPCPQPSHTLTPGKFNPAVLMPLRLHYHRLLAPLCSQIEVAGSVRRGKPLVHDLEFVIVENSPGTVRGAIAQDFFDRMKDPIIDMPIGRTTKHYRMLKLRERLPSGDFINVELYVSQPEYFGYTLMVRTGSSDWNKAWMSYLKFNKRCRIQDNKIYPHGENRYLQFAAEQQLFDFIGIDFVDPRVRCGERDFQNALYQRKCKR